MKHSAKIRSFVSESFFVEDFADEDSFLQNGIIDSTGMLDLVAFLEDEFSLKIDDSELVPENLDSVANVCHFIERKHQVVAA